METIKLDLIPGKKMPSLHASQYDDGRDYHIDLTENRVPYTLDGTETISLTVRKCDNTLVTMDIANTFAGKSYIEFRTTEQMNACAGFNYGEITIEKNGTQISSLNFYLQVEGAPDEGGITSQSEINNLKRQVHDAVVEELEDNGASETGYDNTESGLEATNVQDAIDELASATPEDVYTKEETDDKFATKTELSNKADVSAIPTKTSQLQNDSGFAQIDDSATANNKAWSSEKTASEILGAINNQSFIALSKQYSSSVLANNGYTISGSGFAGYSVSEATAIDKTARAIVIPYNFNPPNVNTNCVICFYSGTNLGSFILGVVGAVAKGTKISIPPTANYYRITCPDSETRWGVINQYVKDLDYVTDRLYSKGAYTIKGNMTSGTSFEIPQTNCRDNQVYSFTAVSDDFSNLNLVIGHGKTVYESCYITLTPTNCDYTRYVSSAIVTTNAHGLTFSKFIDVKILVTKHGIAKVVIQTADNGNGVYEYTLDITNWTGCSGDSSNEVFTFAELVSGSLSDCIFSWSCADFRKQLWAFGDSYFAYFNTRWLYYLEQDGFYDNILNNSNSGENSAKAIIAFKNMLEYFGKPKYILWCMGQNDGSDTTVANYNNWVAKIEEVINICKANDITPILCTIPSVPKNGGRSHELKNAWIRSGGYRYVDMAKAVGAEWNNGSVTWYPSMLASDNEHPDVEGGKAIEKRMLMECPELTFSN